MSCVRVAIHLACAIGRRCGVLRRSCANSPTNEPSLLLLPLPLLPASGKKRSRLQAASDSEEEQAEAPAEGAGEGEGEGELGGDAADDAADDVSSAAPQIPVPPLHSTVTFAALLASSAPFSEDLVAISLRIPWHGESNRCADCVALSPDPGCGQTPQGAG